jgi:hypothetical protein
VLTVYSNVFFKLLPQTTDKNYEKPLLSDALCEWIKKQFTILYLSHRASFTIHCLKHQQNALHFNFYYVLIDPLIIHNKS